MRRDKVLLVFMPFGTIEIPPLGVGLLKAALGREGIECDVRYYSLDFAARYLPAEPRRAAGYLQHLQAPRGLAFHGEWLFARVQFQSVRDAPPPPPATGKSTRTAELAREYEEVVEWVHRTKDEIPGFLDACVEGVRWEEYAIVGFSSSFSQNLASLALALELKRRHPEITTVMGGANVDGPLARATVRLFPQIDFAFPGEADTVFPAFAKRILAGRDARGLPGVVGRDDPDGVGPVPIVPELDLLPYPDHDDYYARARQLGIDDLVGRCISIETSRGCSWGEKCHCTFCGRNADGMAFRKKSVPRVLAEIEHLGRRHAARSFLTTDSILDHGYVRDLLPEIALLGWEIDLFFEVRASLRPEEIETLRRAGVTRIQPGIESLSTRILGLMRKGTTLLQNIQCLRACRAQGIHPVWHHLFGFPGETLADYERILDIVPSLRHLDAPQSLNSVVVQRFSPYFDQASDFGIENLRPFAGYEAIYPFAPRDVFDLAYNFDHDVRGGADPALLSLQSGTLADALRDWRLGFEHDGAELAAFRVGGRALVLDSRGRERIAWALGEPETRVLDALETPGTRATALRRLRRAGPAGGAGRPEGILLALLGPLFGPDGNRMLFALATGQVREGGYRVQSIEDVVPGDSSWTASALEGTIERLVRARLVLEDAGRYLSLPIPRRFRDMRSPSPPSVHGRAG